MAFGHPWHLDTRGIWMQGWALSWVSRVAAPWQPNSPTITTEEIGEPLPARGAGHSAGLGVWGVGWWLQQAARVRSPWLSPNLHPKLAGQLWLSFLTSLWPSSFPIEAGKSLWNLLGNCT